MDSISPLSLLIKQVLIDAPVHISLLPFVRNRAVDPMSVVLVLLESPGWVFITGTG